MKKLIVVGSLVFLFALAGCGQAPEVDDQEDSLAVTQGDALDLQQIESYPFGTVLEAGLDEIGAAGQVEEAICEVSNLHGTTFRLTTSDGPRLWASVYQASDEVWVLQWIRDYDHHGYYYVNDSEKFVDDILAVDLYDYSSGALIEAADREALAAYSEEKAQEREQALADQRQEQIDKGQAMFSEIYAAYKENELAAKDAYNGNRYTLAGTINGMATGGLANMTGGATLTMEITVGNTIVFYYAEFEKEQEDALKQIKVGDTIVFEGECLNAGNWKECELK